MLMCCTVWPARRSTGPAASGGEAELLRIGHTPAVTGDEITTLLRRVHATHPELASEVNQRYPHELTE